jgi:carboxymethylenebutenolidase
MSDTVAVAASAPEVEIPAGFCADCVRGFSWIGTPTGTTQALGPYKTVYVAPAPGGAQTKGAPAIILFMDIFGFSVRTTCLRCDRRAHRKTQLPNPKILADRLANDVGVVVYVPDLFDSVAKLANA